MTTLTDQKFDTSSVKPYLGLIVYLVIAKILLGFIPVTYSDPSQATIFQWSSIAVLTAAGLTGGWLADRSGFPCAWARNISNRERIVIPAMIGVALGILSLGINSALHLPKLDVAFPASIFVYSAGAIAVEVFYRLVPISLFLWLISTVLLRNRGQEVIFWILAVLLSALEPVAQGRALMEMSVSGLPLALTLLVIYAANLIQAYFFRKYGFLASLAMRISYYAIWHVIGNILF